MTGERHKQKFSKWRARQPAKIKMLIDAVVEEIVPQLERRGFIWENDLFDRGKVEIGRADEIAMVRRGDGYLDNLSIGFSKKQQPYFSIDFRRWTDSERTDGEMWLPHYLSKWTSEKWRAKKFGFIWLDPFITPNRCKKVVNEVIRLLPQMDECFETGKTGPNVTETLRMGVAKPR